MADSIVQDEQQLGVPRRAQRLPLRRANLPKQFADGEELQCTRPDDAERGRIQDDQPLLPHKRSRRPWAWLALGVLAAVAIRHGIPYYLYARVHESTDDAFIEGHVVPISPRVAGHVARSTSRTINGSSRGICWSNSDPRDFEVRLAAAESMLEAARAGRTPALSESP